MTSKRKLILIITFIFNKRNELKSFAPQENLFTVQNSIKFYTLYVKIKKIL